MTSYFRNINVQLQLSVNWSPNFMIDCKNKYITNDLIWIVGCLEVTMLQYSYRIRKYELKGICLSHKRDFEPRFTDEQS
ncbi:hypothetical protein BH18THE2_BH18THE2_22280 [soil metagenome]